MTLPETILSKLEREHRGINNAMRREDLLQYLWRYDSGMTDRIMRKLVKSIPSICSCERGYYLPKNRYEADYAIAYLKKKIFPLWDDIKRIQDAYPEFYEHGQLELPL